MAIDSALYYVMKHYSLSLKDLDELSQDQFDQMFTWAAAVDAYTAEKQEKEMGASKSQMKVAGTDGSKPMPFSKGW